MEYLELGALNGSPAGVYRYAGRHSTAMLLRRAAHQGARGWLLHGNTITDKASFLDQCGRVMGFPAYCGRNWDAFEECVTDLAWAPARGYLLVYDSPHPFAAASPADWETALAILAETVNDWRQRDKPFYVLLRRTHGCAPEIPLLA